MKKINFGRVVLGGLLAGILINISEYLRYDIVMRGEFEAGLQALGKRLPKGAVATTIWTLAESVVATIAGAWLYREAET